MNLGYLLFKSAPMRKMHIVHVHIDTDRYGYGARSTSRRLVFRTTRLENLTGYTE